MPFTAAHPAIVLPFLRIRQRYVSATGLIIGSIAPDFEYFLRMNVESEYSHTVAGIFYFDIPVSFLLALAFNLVRRPFIDHLRRFFRTRLAGIRNLDVMKLIKCRWGPFIVSAAAGAGSHIFWDNFTHSDGFFVRNLPSVYQGAYIPFEGVKYPLWYALQHISTFAGLTTVLAYISFLKPRPADPVPLSGTVFYWLSIAGLTSLVFMLRFLIDSSDFSIGNAVVTFISSICIAMIVAGFVASRRKQS